jgi:hypothetical protein
MYTHIHMQRVQDSVHACMCADMHAIHEHEAAGAMVCVEVC